MTVSKAGKSNPLAATSVTMRTEHFLLVKRPSAILRADGSRPEYAYVDVMPAFCSIWNIKLFIPSLL